MMKFAAIAMLKAESFRVSEFQSFKFNDKL